MATRLATSVRNAAADAIADTVDVGTLNLQGTLRIYSGTQPATASSPASGTLLATVDLSQPAFGAAASGVVTLLGVPLSTVGLPAAGAGTTAGWFRMINRDEVTVLDGSVGISGSGAELIVNTATISENVSFEITSGTLTMPDG